MGENDQLIGKLDGKMDMLIDFSKSDSTKLHSKIDAIHKRIDPIETDIRNVQEKIRDVKKNQGLLVTGMFILVKGIWWIGSWILSKVGIVLKGVTF